MACQYHLPLIASVYACIYVCVCVCVSIVCVYECVCVRACTCVFCIIIMLVYPCTYYIYVSIHTYMLAL